MMSQMDLTTWSTDCRVANRRFVPLFLLAAGI
jgi:hypothetical protein